MPSVFSDKDGSLSEVEQRYLRSGSFNGRCGFGEKPAVLVVDFVKYATDPDSPLYGGPIVVKAVEQTAKLLDEARKWHIPVIYTVLGWEEDFDREFGPLGSKIGGLRHVRLGDKWAEVCDEVKPQPGEPVIAKQTSSAFVKTAIPQMLKELGIDTVIVTGHSTSGCVRTTACDAIQYGYKTIVVKDCVGDRAQIVHDANLFDIDAKFADVVSAEDVLSYFRKFEAKSASGNRLVAVANSSSTEA